MFKKKLINKKTALIFLAVVIYNVIAYLLSAPTQDDDFFGDSNRSYPFLIHAEKTNYTYPVNTLARDDYSRLIDIREFSFKILPKHVCINSTLLLVLVHSASDHFDHRNLLRTTWGAPNNMLNLIFFVGSVSDTQLQRKLEEESLLYSDIAQGNFVDVYRNLTYKHMMALKYAVYHCPKAKYILKTDDDVFVNIPLLENFLTKDLSTNGASNLLFCNVIKNGYAIRSTSSKWMVTTDEYPNTTYPTFCLGWAILYSPDVLFALYKTGQKSDYFWVDDVQVTGILAEENKIPHTDVQGLLIPKFDFWMLKYFRIEPKKSFLYGRPDLSPNEIKILWKYVTSHPVPKSIFKLENLSL